MADKLQQVEMHTAYVWDCPECGREQFQRCITHVFDRNDESDREMVEAMYGPEAVEQMDADATIGFKATTYPNTVTCQACDTTFATCGTSTDEDDGEDLDPDAE